MFQGYSQETVDFMWGIRFNNERGWFLAHKDDYQQHLLAPTRELGQAVYEGLSAALPQEPLILKVSRIYRDARRLHGQGPYKDHLWFCVRTGDQDWTGRPTFYFEIAPDYYSYGMGFWAASAATMTRYRQQIEKGFAMYLYDFKFDDLSSIAYNHLLNHLDAYETRPKFCIINFDDPRRSNRCNPIAPEFMTDISDAYESAYTIMLNLNKTWIQKQGDFFVDSPIILLAAIIWYLKIYEGGKYCTFPHAIELLCKRYEDIFTILTSYPELENYLSPFMDAWKGGAQDQLQGQIASAKIPLSRMISPQLYWVMTGNDFTLDINNPEDPKILCVGNNPDRQNIYSAALGLYNSRIVRLINKKGKLKSSIIIDELPTIYFRGLDNLIATARSNKVAVCLSFQDFSQLERDYGQEEAKVIENTVGNIFAGQVLGDTAKTLSERFGRIVQLRTSNSLSNDNLTTSTNTQLDSLIPASKISNLSQGMFVGAVADNFDERIEQKIFHAEIVIDREKLAGETASYVPIPEISSFRDADGVDRMEEIIRRNYAQIKEDVTQIIKRELRRIAEDPALRHLLAKK